MPRSMWPIIIILAVFAYSGQTVEEATFAVAPNLGTAQDYAVLGSTSVINMGNTIVDGNLGISGLFEGNSVTGFPPGVVTGAINTAATTQQADLDNAYLFLSQFCDVDLTGQNLGGLILLPGKFCFNLSAQLNGTLTLNGLGDANAVFIFSIGDSLNTASNAAVSLINGTTACNVFWQVDSTAILGTNTTFQGNVLALRSITLNTGATNVGGLFALYDAVIMDTNNVTVCAPTIAPTSAPTAAPPTIPIDAPTPAPTTSPTEAPTAALPTIPTDAPTTAPTSAPTAAPPTIPTDAPTTSTQCETNADCAATDPNQNLFCNSSGMCQTVDCSTNVSVCELFPQSPDLCVVGRCDVTDGLCFYLYCDQIPGYVCNTEVSQCVVITTISNSGVAIGAFVFVALVVLICVCLWCIAARSRRNRRE